MSLDYTARWVPGHVWVRVALGRNIEPGHRWMYHGIVRRDTATVRGYGLVLARMPNEQSIEAYRLRTGWTSPDPSNPC